MTDIVLQRNIGALGDLVRISAHATALAAGTGDATTVTGISIDRLGFGGSKGGMPQSALFDIGWGATLTANKTLSLSYAIQDSADNSNFSDYQTAAAVVVGSATGAQSGNLNIPVNLTSARRYVRLLWFPDLSHTGTDTALGDAFGFFAGFERLPAPTS